MSSTRAALAALALAQLVVTRAGAEPPPAPSGDILIESWKVVGPFETGSREGFVNPLADWQGHVADHFTFDETYPSVLADGGRVGWRDQPADCDDAGQLTERTTLRLEGVNWDAREDEWGAAGSLNTAFLYGEFTLDAPQTLILDAARCSAVINGLSYSGDPYGAGIARSALVGRAGVNTVLVQSAGGGPQRAFDFRLHRVGPDTPPVMILDADVTLPDVVPGMSGTTAVGVPLLNTTTRWVRDVVVDVGGAALGGRSAAVVLAPLSSRKVLVPCTVVPPGAEPPDSKLPVEIRVASPEGASGVTVTARWRKPDEPRVETVVSAMGSSAQQFGVLQPKDYDASRRYALILTTHGAGVGPSGQAAAYSQKDWAFVVAPTNRRPFGFDWQDWGRLDFEEVYRHVLAEYPIDPERVIITGHSMGGHGAWLMGVHHADWFAACSPSAGWSGYDTYVPPTLRRSQNFAPAELSSYWLRGIASDRVTPFLENLGSLPVFALQGGADDNVPAPQARLIVGALSAMGQGAVLREVPGQGHWWDVDKTRPGADCVDSAELEAFWRDKTRVRWPHDVVLVTVDPDVDGAQYWVHLERQRQVAMESRIEARLLDASTIRVTTRNVERLALTLSPELGLSDNVLLAVGDAKLRARVPPNGGRVEIARDGGRWHVVPNTRSGAMSRAASLRPGGVRKALFEPFVIVAGTEGGAERSEMLLHVARTLAATWWVRGNGSAPIVRDVDVDDEMRASLNLVLVGGPEANAETRALAAQLLVVATSRGVSLAGGRVDGDDLACVHWQPSPRHPGRRVLVFQATNAQADRLLPSLNPIGGGIGLPDYVVAGPEVRARSWGGFHAVGWWTPDFRYDPANGWRASD